VNHPVRRRDFLAGAAAAATLTIVGPGSARGAEAANTLSLGLIGCGGRGNWISNLFQKNAPWKIAAVADYFADRANRTGERLKVDASRRFSTLSGYKRLLGCKLDAVAIMTPPYFHPQQAADAVEAGKHVFVAKPIAVDVPGCLAIAAAGKRATEKKQVFLVDFQTRANPFYQGAVKWVHDGNVGKVVLIQANYFTRAFAPSPANDSAEARLRAWVSDKDFSGDIIVEQNIHALDVATWFLDADPLGAVGTGGNAVHAHKGTCWDHFAVLYHCPGEVVIDFSSTQCTQGLSDIGCRVFAQHGTADTHYGGIVVVRGRKSYRGGNTGPIFTQGCVQNIKDFHKQITEGKVANGTVAPSVRSNLTCILGREAAYKGKPLTWAEMMKEARVVDPRPAGLKA